MSRASLLAKLAALNIASDDLGNEILAMPADGGPSTDNFNRTNQFLENDSENWTRVGGTAGDARIESNVLKSFTSDAVGAAYLCKDTGVAAQYVGGVFQSNTCPSFLCVRITDPGNWLGMRWYNGNIEAWKRIGGGDLSKILSFATPRGSSVFQANYDPIAATIRILKDSTQIVAPTSVGVVTGLPASTRAGLVVRGAALPFIDNFIAGPL